VVGPSRRERRASGITWRRADAHDSPFPDVSFDAIVCQFGLMFVPDKARAFSEKRRVLRAREQLAFSIWCSLAENPLGRIARDTIARYFTSNPPDFYEVPFSFHDEWLIREPLAVAQFGQVSCERVVLVAQSASTRDAVCGLVTGNPTVLDVVERATASPDEIVAAVAAALTAECDGATLRLPMRALVVVPMRPDTMAPYFCRAFPEASALEI